MTKAAVIKKGPVKLVLADDHHIIRQSLKMLLEAQEDFQVVGEACNGLEAIELVEKLKPDLLVLDLMMPVLNGLETLRRLSRIRLKTVSIILSCHENEAYVAEAFSCGAAGYVLKQSTSAHLIQAVREVMSGRRYLSPPLSERAIDTFIKRSAAGGLERTSSVPTLREFEVLNLVGEGYTNAEIADRLHLSPRTVEHHRSRLMRKLRCRNHAELIRCALVYAQDGANGRDKAAS